MNNITIIGLRSKINPTSQDVAEAEAKAKALMREGYTGLAAQYQSWINQARESIQARAQHAHQVLFT